MSMPTSACWRTTSMTDSVRQASNAVSSYGLPSSIDRQNSISFGGRIRLPTWVVRMRSVLCGTGGFLIVGLAGAKRHAHAAFAKPASHRNYLTGGHGAEPVIGP